MFNTNENIKITLKTPEGPKGVEVKYPSDEQWISRTSKIKITSRNIGRGKSRDSVTKSEELNAQLFDQIVQNDVKLDIWEKSTIIERLSKAEVTDSKEDNLHYYITVVVPGGETVHKLKRPYEKQKKQYRESAVNFTTSRNGLTEMTVNLTASETLYDELLVEATGYDSPVPVIHKSTVIGELMNLLKEEEEESDIENF